MNHQSYQTTLDAIKSLIEPIKGRSFDESDLEKIVLFKFEPPSVELIPEYPQVCVEYEGEVIGECVMRLSLLNSWVVVAIPK